MKKIYVLIVLLVCVNTILYAQETELYNNSRFYASASVLGVMLSFDVDEEDFDAEIGGGLGLKAGYHFTDNIGLFVSLDASSISTDGESYALAHFDLGAQWTFRSVNDRVRPFARASVTGMSVQDDLIGISGRGFGLGAGVCITLNQKWGIDVGITHSRVSISEVEIASVSFEADGNATTNRLSAGVKYFF